MSSYIHYGLCLFVYLFICLSVRGLEVTVFDIWIYFFGSGLLGWIPPDVFFVFLICQFLGLLGPFFGLFRVFSSLSLVILLYGLQVAMIDLQTWSLTQRVFMTPLRGVFNDFWKFAFLPLLGALLFSKRALKAKRHKCGHRDIISWYSGSMWQRNVGKQYYVWKFLILMS